MDMTISNLALFTLHLQRIHFFKFIISLKKTKERLTKYCAERKRYLINFMNSNYTAKTTLFILLLFHSLYFYVIVFFFTCSFQYARAKKKNKNMKIILTSKLKKRKRKTEIKTFHYSTDKQKF